MASTGPARFPSTTEYPNTNVYPGQGTLPILLCQYATDDLAEDPTWLDASAYVRSFSISRGRDRELADVDAGTAQIVLDNRARTFDPLHNTDIRPRNRWRIREQFTGETQDMFFGYAESYDQLWPDGSGVVDAVAVVNLVDEFKLLQQRRLPTMDPPRDTYADVVQFDNPHTYWRFQDKNSTNAIERPTVGSVILSPVAAGATVTYVDSPIVGDSEESFDFNPWKQARAIDTGWSTHVGEDYTDEGLEPAGPGDVAGLNAWTLEFWWMTNEGPPGGTRGVARGPLSGGIGTWSISHTTSSTLTYTIRNTGTTPFTCTSAALAADTWYHLAFVYDAGTMRLYVNGVEHDNEAFSGSVGAMDAGQYTAIGAISALGGTRSYDEVAWYQTALSADRLLAHYTAGVSRGYGRQDPGVRLNSILDTISSRAPRRIRSGSREMVPVFQHGQPALTELRKAQAAENVDSVLYIGRDGAVVFLDDGHRSSSPWNTVQATFDDDGTDLPYHGLDVDYSDSFLANVVNATRANGTTTTESDSTSISRYGQTEPLSLTDLPITSSSDQEDIAEAILAKVKDPMYRFVSMDLTCADPDLIEAVFARDIGDRIRIFRTPPGGGSRIDQTVFIQRIEIQGDPSRVFRVRWAVTPL